MKKEEEVVNDFYDNSLTRIDPDTKFVIEKNSGLIRWVYKKHAESKVIGNLMNMYGIPINRMRRNSYGDILLL